MWTQAYNRPGKASPHHLLHPTNVDFDRPSGDHVATGVVQSIPQSDFLSGGVFFNQGTPLAFGAVYS